MQFYDIIATVDNKLPQNREQADYQLLAEKLYERSENDYHTNNQSHYFFTTGIEDERIRFFAIFKTNTDVTTAFMSFISTTKLKIKNISMEETIFRKAKITLALAGARKLVNNRDDILKDFDLDDLYSDYTEELLNGNLTKDSLINKSKAMLFEETLLPEMERIYTECPACRIKGHPVHYLVCCDDRNSQEKIYRVLLEALYANERIQSKRICCVDFTSDDRTPDSSYDALYKSCENGVLVVRYTPLEDEESDRARPGEGVITVLCDTAKKFRNRVLTIFCIPDEASKTKDKFLEKLINLPLIELYENKASGSRAKEYFKTLADEYGIAPDRQLYDKIEDETKLYRAVQLKSIFEEWYNHKLLHSVYPQYEKAKISSTEIVKEKPKGSAIDELNEMIGLKDAKAVIYKALNYYKVQKLYQDKGIATGKPAMHMVFTGNPGTAKTTVARLFAEIMRDNGLLTKGDLYEVGRADLVGKYVGWTAQIVKDKFKAAKGSVLFIDEAYSLIDDKEGLYGDEAINTIVQEMENNRENMIVIFAGYSDKMEDFLRRNPGLRSRIAFHVPFHDYDTDELVNIAELIVRKNNLRFTQESHDKLVSVLDMARKTADFGNGRYVRNLIEQARMEQANRIVQMDCEDVTEETLQTLTESDIPVLDTPLICERRRIGF